MELIDVEVNYEQNFGFIVYRTKIPKIKNLIIKG
jgi:hypothetical protein